MVRPVAGIASYHAHVYFEPGQEDAARRVREGVGVRFAVRLGTWIGTPLRLHEEALPDGEGEPEPAGESITAPALAP